MSEVTTTNQEQAVAQPQKKQPMSAVMPANIVTAMRLAQTLSESNLIPKALQGKPADVLIVLLKGEELGFKYMQSLGSIDVIQGKARVSAEATVALVLRSGQAEYFDLVESTAKVATYCTKRKGSTREVTMSYTIEEATIAGLAGKDNWKTHPAAMLRARASQSLARAVFPDATLGLVNDDEAEELKALAAATIETAPSRPRTIDQVIERLQEQSVDAQSTPVEQIAAQAQPSNDSPEPDAATVSGQHPPTEHASAPATVQAKPSNVTAINGGAKTRRF